MMTEGMKATLKLIVSALVGAATSALTSVMASGQDSFTVFRDRPSVWLGMFIAVGTLIATSLTKSPAQGAALDRERTATADAKAEEKLPDKVADKVQTLLDTGVLRLPGDGK